MYALGVQHEPLKRSVSDSCRRANKLSRCRPTNTAAEGKSMRMSKGRRVACPTALWGGIVLMLVCASVASGYTAWMNHRDSKAYSEGIALLSKLDAEPVSYRTFEGSQTTWYEKCGGGFCRSSTDQDSLEAPLRKKASTGGIPVTDYSAIHELQSKAASHE